MPQTADPAARLRLSRDDARAAVMLRRAVHHVALDMGLTTKRRVGRHRAGSGPLAAVIYARIEMFSTGPTLVFAVAVSRDIGPEHRDAWQRGTTAAVVHRLSVRGLVVAERGGSIVEGRQFGVPVRQLAMRQGIERAAQSPVAGSA